MSKANYALRHQPSLKNAAERVASAEGKGFLKFPDAAGDIPPADGDVPSSGGR